MGPRGSTCRTRGYSDVLSHTHWNWPRDVTIRVALSLSSHSDWWPKIDWNAMFIWKLSLYPSAALEQILSHYRVCWLIVDVKSTAEIHRQTLGELISCEWRTRERCMECDMISPNASSQFHCLFVEQTNKKRARIALTFWLRKWLGLIRWTTAAMTSGAVARNGFLHVFSTLAHVQRTLSLNRLFTVFNNYSNNRF